MSDHYGDGEGGWQEPENEADRRIRRMLSKELKRLNRDLAATVAAMFEAKVGEVKAAGDTFALRMAAIVDQHSARFGELMNAVCDEVQAHVRWVNQAFAERDAAIRELQERMAFLQAYVAHNVIPR